MTDRKRAWMGLAWGELDETLFRKALVDNAAYYCGANNRSLLATGRQQGHARFEDVVEGRQASWLHNGKVRNYSACGDLGHKVIYETLGASTYSDSKSASALMATLINRNEANGWKVGVNLSRFVYGRHGCWRNFQPNTLDMSPGDIMIIGDGGRGHLSVIKQRTPYGYDSYDYGQWWAPAQGAKGGFGGRVKKNTISKRGSSYWNRDRRLIGVFDSWKFTQEIKAAIDRDNKALSDVYSNPMLSARVPAWSEGIPDDNPYYYD